MLSFWQLFVNPLRFLSAVRRGITTPLQLFDKVPRKAPTPLSSKPNYRLTGPAHIRSSLSAPHRRLTSPTAGLFTTSSFTSTSPPTCRDETAIAVSLSLDENLANPPDEHPRPAQTPSCQPHQVRPQLLSPQAPSPNHVTTYGITTPTERLEVKQITGHQLARGRGGVVAVLYETYCEGLLSPSWQRGPDLQLFRHHTLRCWSGSPSQHRQANRLYRQMRIVAARRELSRFRGEIFIALGYSLVSRALWLRRF